MSLISKAHNWVTQNTISHQDNNSIKKFVQANWTAPVDFVGTVVFK